MRKAHKIAIVAAGLSEIYESEAFDREHMGLPEGHNRMIEAVAVVNPNTVVVLLGGSAMELPWADKVKAILYMGLPGQAGGQAMANLLTGKVNPSGKLTETCPLSYQDVISKNTFGRQPAKLAKLSPQKLAARKTREAKKAAAIDHLWEKEEKMGNAYRTRIQAELTGQAK